jgi:predicted TIM-barrel fold metal-dependent hydrolase
MQKLIDNVSIDQLLFGSDGGLGNVDKQSYVGLRWQMFESLNLDAEIQTKILSTNPERLLRGVSQ